MEESLFNGNLKKSKGFAERSLDTQVVVDLLRKVPVGETLSYSALSEATGKDVQGDGRWILESARRILIREEKILFECVWGEGVRRLDNKGILGVGQQGIDGIRRKARLAAKKISCVNYEELEESQKVTFNAVASVVGVIHHMATRKGVRQIVSRVQETKEKLSLSKTLDAFRK